MHRLDRFMSSGDSGDNRRKPARLVLLTVFAAVTASAQTADRESATERGGRAIMEEILVTAQKKSTAEAVQDVPIAISAYSGRKIEAMFANDLIDIGHTAPNVQLSQQGTVPGTANFSIRGWGTTGQSIPSSDPAVGVVQDGVPFGTIYSVVTDVFDLESVEVLRGPQGTLFGRNVSAGAVVLRTTRPSHDEMLGKFKVGGGSDSLREISALITGPLNDKWAGKAAVMWKDRDGYWDNIARGDQQGNRETIVLRPAIGYQGASFTFTGIAEYGEMKGHGMSARNFFCVGVPALGLSDCDPFAATLDPYADAESRQTVAGRNDLEWAGLSLEGIWDLWGGALTGILGYREVEQSVWGDIDGAPNTIRFQFGPGTGFDQDQQSLEVRWSGNIGDKWDLTTGINLFNQEYTYDERRLLIDLIDFRASSTIEHFTAGLFAQADFFVSDRWTLTLGGRWSFEEKDAAIGVIGDPTATGNCAPIFGSPSETSPASLSDCRPAFIDSQDWSNFTPRVGLKWFLSENLMAYGSYSRGFRSGGYNVRFSDTTLVTQPDNPTSTPGPYDEEVVDAFEIGFKSDFADGRARLNGAVFHNEFDDMQLSANNRSGVQTIFNAAKATMLGVELDGVFLVTDRLTIEASYGFVDASYDEADFLVRQFGPGTDVGDFLLQMVSENTFHAGVTFDHGVGDAGSLSWRAAYSYADEAAADNFNFLILEDYSLLDASVTFRNADENLKVAFYGKNLTDEVYFTFGFDNSNIGSRTMWLTPPRTWGIELTYEF